MPFTRDSFFSVFAAYNEAIWPLQLAAIAAGIAVLVLLMLRPGRAATLATALVLAAIWAVNGIGYHWLFFAAINPLARVFGVLFVVQASLFVLLPVLDPNFRFDLIRDRASLIGLGLAAFALAVYPLWGWLAGERWPAMPIFGVAPCPSTIFTLGLLLMARGKGRLALMAIPMAWAAIGGAAAVLLGVPQDFGLIAALLLAAALLAFQSRANRADTRPASRP